MNEQADKDRREQRAGDGIEENNEELGDEAPKVGTSVMGVDGWLSGSTMATNAKKSVLSGRATLARSYTCFVYIS